MVYVSRPSLLTKGSLITSAGECDGRIVEKTEDVRMRAMAENVTERQGHHDETNDDVEHVQIRDESAAHVVQHQLVKETTKKNKTSNAGRVAYRYAGASKPPSTSQTPLPHTHKRTQKVSKMLVFPLIDHHGQTD